MQGDRCGSPVLFLSFSAVLVKCDDTTTRKKDSIISGLRGKMLTKRSTYTVPSGTSSG